MADSKHWWYVRINFWLQKFIIISTQGIKLPKYLLSSHSLSSYMKKNCTALFFSRFDVESFKWLVMGASTPHQLVEVFERPRNKPSSLLGQLLITKVSLPSFAMFIKIMFSNILYLHKHWQILKIHILTPFNFTYLQQMIIAKCMSTTCEGFLHSQNTSDLGQLPR